MLKYAALPLIFLACAPAPAEVKRGSPAVEINLDLLLPDQPLANARLESLAGKAIVLEFWATWCAPCIDAIPHINELARQFKDRPIQFLSVTDEDPALVEGFLKKKPISGWVGFDRKKTMWKAYGFEGIPTTVLIDANGRFAGMTHPNGLRPSVLDDLMAGKPLSLPLMPTGPSTMVTRGDSETGPPLLDILIRPSAQTPASTGMRASASKIEAQGNTLKGYLAMAYDLPAERIEGAPVEEEQRYDVLISGPKGFDWKPMLRSALAAAFRISVEKEMRDSDVLLLEAPNGKPEALKETVSTGGMSSNTGKSSLKYVNGSMRSLAGSMQTVLKRPVVDETGVKEHFDLELKWDGGHPESMIDAVKALGLTIEPGRRSLEYLVVKKL